MAINKKLINFKKKEDFLKEKEQGNILETSIVFIDDSKEIFTHNTLFNCDKALIEKILPQDYKLNLNDSVGFKSMYIILTYFVYSSLFFDNKYFNLTTYKSPETMVEEEYRDLINKMKEGKTINISADTDLMGNLSLTLNNAYILEDTNGNGEYLYNYSYSSNAVDGLFSMEVQLFLRIKDGKEMLIATPISFSINKIEELDELYNE